MAEQNPEQVNLEIKLNEVLVGKRALRYIYLYHPDVVSTEWDKTRECTPLFLGSDVLVECNISRGNQPRVHAKHAKRGLATKVNFPVGTKILGIHGTTRGVWFYSIQGTFKIAFDYYSREDQDGCLSQLQKVWRRQILDPMLKNEIQVVVRRETDISLEPQVVRREDETEMVGRRMNGLEFVEEINQTIDNFALVTKEETLQRELGLLKTYTSFINIENSEGSFVNRTVSLLKSLLGLLPLIRSENNGDLSKKEEILSEIARWLGTEFANYHAHVNERVTAFKQKHIRNIENLPPAELLVREVFPASMLVLFCSWLRLPSTGNLSPTHEGSKGSTDAQALRLFPVVQIILELTNQSLLSGVAHVLYSRLIRSETV